MSLQLRFLERGVPAAQELGEVAPGSYATFLDIAHDEPVVFTVVCLQKVLQGPQGPSYGQVYAGDSTYLLDIPPDGLNHSNRIGDIPLCGHWHREVVSAEHETGLLLVSHVPDGWPAWELS